MNDSGQEVFRFENTSSSIDKPKGNMTPTGVVALSPDGRIIADGGKDGSVGLFDVASGSRITGYEPLSSWF